LNFIEFDFQPCIDYARVFEGAILLSSAEAPYGRFLNNVRFGRAHERGLCEGERGNPILI